MKEVRLHVFRAEAAPSTRPPPAPGTPPPLPKISHWQPSPKPVREPDCDATQAGVCAPHRHGARAPSGPAPNFCTTKTAPAVWAEAAYRLLILADARRKWSGQPDLNRRPLRPERSALPSCAMPRCPVTQTLIDISSRWDPTPTPALSRSAWIAGKVQRQFEVPNTDLEEATPPPPPAPPSAPTRPTPPRVHSVQASKRPQRPSPHTPTPPHSHAPTLPSPPHSPAPHHAPRRSNFAYIASISSS